MIATLFDFDGVLVDSEPVHLAAFNDVLAPLGMSIDTRTYSERYLSFDDAGVFRDVLATAGGTPDEDQVRSFVEAKVPASSRASRPLSGRFREPPSSWRAAPRAAP